MQELKVGLIGLGFIGKLHAQAYRNIPGMYPQAQITPRLAALLVSSRKHDLAAGESADFALVTTSLDEFLSVPLDLVDVCLPNTLHEKYVVAALQAGLPVYFENPSAADLAQARRLAALARQQRVPNKVTFNNRYLPAVREMRTALVNGLIGEVQRFRAVEFHPSYIQPQRSVPYQPQRQPIRGAMLEIGIHMIDLILYLLGDVCSVTAEARSLIPPGPAAAWQTMAVDDWMLAHLECATGVCGTLEVSRLTAGCPACTRLEIYGTQGTLTFNHDAPERVRYHNQKTNTWQTGIPAGLALPPNERPLAAVWPDTRLDVVDIACTYTASIYDFLLDIVEGTPALADFSAGVRAQEVVEASYRAAAQNCAIQLPLSFLS